MNIFEDILFFSPSIKRELDFGNAICSSDAEFFFEKTASKIFAVSGSDGKSTTSTMAAMLLGKKARLGGNIGVPFCEFLHFRGNFVAELSSFQLNYFAPPSFSAVLTSVSENHLDFHGDFAAYVSAKENLLKNAERRALWTDSEIERELCLKYKPNTVISFLDAYPDLKRKFKAESYVSIAGGCVLVNGFPVANCERLFEFGDYTVKNFMSAIALTEGFYSEANRVANTFIPLNHRCEPLGEVAGVKYYDSSIDSTPQRTVETLSRFSQNVILILGGRDKGLDPSPLEAAIKSKVKLCVLYGESGAKFKEKFTKSRILRHCDIDFCYFYDFYDAVKFAKENASKGDTVLLSPASTSYGQFANFEERGEAFRKIINS